MNKLKGILIVLILVGALMSFPTQAHATTYPDPSPIACVNDAPAIVDNEKFNISFLVYRWHITSQDATSVTYRLQLDINPTNNELWINVSPSQVRVVSLPVCPHTGTPPTFGENVPLPGPPGVCVNNSIGRVAHAVVLQGTPNDNSVTINWALPINANEVHIIYREEGRGWEHALRNAPNDGHTSIGALKNGIQYHFAIAGVNGCAVGPWSAEYAGRP